MEQDWYASPKDIEVARDFLGEISLDPASDSEAQKLIRANTYWDRSVDGYRQDWFGKVWCYPPGGTDRDCIYGQDRGRAIQYYWLLKGIKEYQESRIEEAIFLTYRTDSTWYQDLIPRFYACYQKREKIRLGRNQKSIDYLYLGDRAQDFYRHYAANYGAVVPHSFWREYGENSLAPGKIWYRAQERYVVLDLAVNYPDYGQLIICQNQLTRSTVVFKVDILLKQFKPLK